MADYKRRIMVGDDLTNQKVHYRIPPYYDAAIVGGSIAVAMENGSEVLRVGAYKDINVGYLNLFYEYYNPEYEYTGENVFFNWWLDEPQVGTETVGFFPRDDERLGVVTSVSENSQPYRHLFIEDPYIRPIEVGDDLSGKTLYFTFPDDFWEDTLSFSGTYPISMGVSPYNDAGSILVQNHTSYNGPAQVLFVRNNLVSIKIYETGDGGEPILTNISKLVAPIEGNLTVIAVDKTNPAYQYIFVAVEGPPEPPPLGPVVGEKYPLPPFRIG